MVSDELAEFIQRLEIRNIAYPPDLVGCSDDEVAMVVEAAGDFPLQPSYLEFLKIMGRKAGALFRGSFFFFPDILELNADAREFAEDDDPTLAVEGRFFFAHHGGYEWYFFEAGSQKVYMHMEEDPPPKLLGENFIDFLWTYIRGRDNYTRRPDYNEFK